MSKMRTSYVKRLASVINFLKKTDRGYSVSVLSKALNISLSVMYKMIQDLRCLGMIKSIGKTIDIIVVNDDVIKLNDVENIIIERKRFCNHGEN